MVYKTGYLGKAEKGNLYLRLRYEHIRKKEYSTVFHCTDDAVDSIQLIQIGTAEKKSRKVVKRKRRIKDRVSISQCETSDWEI